MEKHEERENASWVDQRLAVLNPDDGWQPNVVTRLAQLKDRCKQTGFASKRWVWLTGAVAATCFLLLALPTSRALAHRCLECTVEAWQALAEPGSQAIDLKPETERQIAPDFALKDQQGTEIRLSDLKGKVVLVNFWATWCHGCQIEIPWFIEFEKKYKERGLTILGVSMDDDGWKSVKPWIKEKRVNYAIVIGNQALGKEYGLKGMPLSVLIDRKGKIADMHASIVKRAAEQREIEALLGPGHNRSSD
jgi:peroxiredoxin